MPDDRPPPRVAGRLASRALPWLGVLGAAAGLSLAVSAARFVRAWLAKPLLDDVLLRGEAVWGLLGAAVALVIAIPALEYGRAVLVERVLWRIRVGLERDVCGRLLALPLRHHRDGRRGDRLSRTVRDLDTAHGALHILLGELGLALAMILAGSVTLLWISWQLAAGLVLVAPLLWLLIARFGRRIRRRARRRQEAWSDVTARLLQILDGIQVIKAFRAEQLEREAFSRRTEQLYRRSMQVVRQRLLARGSVELLNGVAALGVIALGVGFVRAGRFGLTPGDVVAFAAALATLYRPVKTLARSWVRWVDAHPAAVRLFQVLDAPGEPPDPPDAAALAGIRQGVAFRGVSYAYGREPVLRDVSFEIPAGRVVALVGRSGAGKSTLADLLLGFAEPDGGRIEIDGTDLRRIQRPSWLSRVAVVQQEPFLFAGTIRDNIRYGRPDADERTLLAAARAAHVDEFAARLPHGLDSEVGTGGIKLSVGQRQRVAIARALLRDPDLLIFDEATSSLDPQSERLVQDATRTLLGDRTVLLIAHRPSTIARADRVVVLEDGRVSQSGAPTDLARSPGPFQQIFAVGSAAASA
jgi:ABC-type multidrug transport system fused ATPase/permease subunit